MHTLARMEASFVCASRIYIQHWTCYLPSRAFYEHTVFRLTSPWRKVYCKPSLRILHRSRTPLVPSSSITPVSAAGFLSYHVSKSPPGIQIRRSKNQHLGSWEWRTTDIYTQNQMSCHFIHILNRYIALNILRVIPMSLPTPARWTIVNTNTPCAC